MIYKRLDDGCRAKVLAVTGDRVLMMVRWPATKHDERKHAVSFGIAQNTTVVTARYFRERYGKEAQVS